LADHRSCGKVIIAQCVERYDMTKNPLVSVIIPAYNCVRTIEKAIDSALSQNVELEVIVVDDCSKDDLDGVMERYGGDPRVIYIKNEHNLGAASSRNKAVLMARGRYIAYLDADDYWAPDKIRKQLKTVEAGGAVLCCTSRELMTPEGKLTGRMIPVNSQITYEDLLKHNSISCSSVLIRTEVALEFPMEHEDAHEDYIMWLRVLKKYQFACGINEPLLKYRMSNTGKSGGKLHSAWMTFKSYRYMGFGVFKSCICFISYALHGVKKYFL